MEDMTKHCDSKSTSICRVKHFVEIPLAYTDMGQNAEQQCVHVCVCVAYCTPAQSGTLF